MPEKKPTDNTCQLLSFEVGEAWKRTDLFLGEQLRQYSRTQLEVFFSESRVCLNGQACKKSEKLKPGDTVTLNLPDVQGEQAPIPEPDIAQNITVLYEDEWIVAIYKPSGLSVHPGSGVREFTVADYFRRRFPQEAELFPDADRPGIVHRLDKDTSGILLMGKSPKAVEALQNEFRKRQIKKSYLAWVDGIVKTPFRRIATPIIRHPRLRIRYTTAKPDAPGAREALTEFRLLAVRNAKSLLRIRLYTGRTHQIRVHMSSIGHPVCGDRLYGSHTPTLGFSDQGIMLHAHRLSFRHPFLSQRIDIFSLMPPRMRGFWHGSKDNCQGSPNGL